MCNTLIHLAGRCSEPRKALRYFEGLEEPTALEAASLVTALQRDLEEHERATGAAFWEV